MRPFRNLLIVLSVAAGAGACIFMFLCHSAPMFIGLVLCVVAWWGLRRSLAPNGVFFHPLARAYRFCVAIAVAAFGAFHDKVPPNIQATVMAAVCLAMFVLIMLYAHADYSDV